jgi:hypothetical protein
MLSVRHTRPAPGLGVFASMEGASEKNQGNGVIAVADEPPRRLLQPRLVHARGGRYTLDTSWLRLRPVPLLSPTKL